MFQGVLCAQGTEDSADSVVGVYNTCSRESYVYRSDKAEEMADSSFYGKEVSRTKGA
jgi:hypothetical protein